MAGQGKKPKLTPSAKNPNSTRMEITGIPISLKKDLIEICGDECCAMNEFVKKVLRKEINLRKPQLGFESR